MDIITKISDWRDVARAARREGLSIGFTPTMGALHDGHMALAHITVAENDIALASIFVNPTQFEDAADLESYPRDFDADCEKLRAEGITHVFAPSVEEMYPEPMETHVDVPLLSSGLIGAIRPGHFQGVAGVVCKLLNIATADRAYFGEKDFQQLAIIRRMVADLNFPTEIIAVPTVREADGLAMSSRNARLTPEDRAAAPVIFRAIELARAEVASGNHDLFEIDTKMRFLIQDEPRAKLERLDIVDVKTLKPTHNFASPIALLINVRFGDVLLIDQAVVGA